MDIYVIADDPCLEQYEFSLYREKGNLSTQNFYVSDVDVRITVELCR